ncbi:MAG: CoA ester lyase [Betaproteobacteria bacterium]|nr:CoA ester lyase [Betaproteobacteria bacterium]
MNAALQGAEAIRSWLWVPAESERKIDKSRASGGDAVILDLEDGTAPANKDMGRSIAQAELKKGGFGASQRWVRVNSPADGNAWHDDLRAVMPAAPDGIVIPKVSDPDHVKSVHAAMGAFATLHRVPMPQLAIIVTENASGVLRMRETMAAVPAGPRGLAAAFWGSEDLSGDLGSISTVDEKGELLDVFRVARSLFLLEARHAGLPAADTPFLGIKDLEGVKRQALAAHRTGFSGMQAIHPDHIAIINAAFTPTVEEIAAAERVLAAFATTGGGAVLVNGAMADPPHLRRARKVLARVRKR